MLKKPRYSLSQDISALSRNLYPTPRNLNDRFTMAVGIVFYHTRSRAFVLSDDFTDSFRNLSAMSSVAEVLFEAISTEVMVSTARNHLLIHRDYLRKRLECDNSKQALCVIRAAIELILDYWKEYVVVDLTTIEVDGDLSEYLTRLISWDIGGVHPYEENRGLRELLASQVGGLGVYRDDGELSDGTAHPIIDFRRFSPRSIRATLMRRAENKRASKTPDAS